jgi:hypothetical protein
VSSFVGLRSYEHVVLTEDRFTVYRLSNEMALSSGGCPSAKAASYLVHHIVLPPQLPQEDDYDCENERFLLRTTIDALRALKTFVTDENAGALAKAIVTIENLQRVQDGSGNISEAELYKLLGEFAHGKINGCIPLEVKAQNAGILVSSDGIDATFEFFELSPLNESAMLKGRLIRSFPGLAACIPLARLQDKGLQSMLADTLAKMSIQAAPGFQPVARKAGQYHDEDRDTTHPGMVTDYLFNVVAAVGKAVTATRITKHTREEVLWNNCKLPWRRSPMWLLVRVTLQLLFTRQSPNSPATDSLYKVFVVQMLSMTLTHAQAYWQMLGSGYMHVINAKMLQRLRKLETLSQLGCVVPAWFDLIQKNMEDAFACMNEKWQTEAHNTGTNLATADLKALRPQNALDVQLPALDDFLAQTAARKVTTAMSNFSPGHPYPSFARNAVPQTFNAADGQQWYRLAAVESWVENHLHTWIGLHGSEQATCEQLYALIKSYHDTAVRTYSGIPWSMSLMYLTILEIWVACDKSACSLFPLLNKYRPEVPLVELQCLTLPLRNQMQRLLAVEEYVQSREQAATNTVSVFCDFGNGSSFAVEYFNQSSELQQLLQKIETDAASKRAEKCRELAQLKSWYTELMNRSRAAECEYVEIVTNRYFGYTKTVHSRYCGRCSLRKQAENLEIKVFEWPVSSVPSFAKATVFELKIPEPYSTWRDTTVFVVNALGCKNQRTERPQTMYTLSNHSDLSQLLGPGYFGRRIVPLSAIKPHLVTHRNNKKGVPHLQDSDVCLQSGLRYQYYDTVTGAWSAPRMPSGDIPRKCMQQMPASSKALERYLQKIPSTPDGAPPNEVIASLPDCPPHFSIEEYKAFGALPLGHDIFYSNILTQLAMPTLDFSKVETQCLILQTVTQTGLPDGNVERVNHKILTDYTFGSAMIARLEDAAQRVEENWESWRALATFIQLACRTANLAASSEVRERCLHFLHKARRTSVIWLHRLKARAASSTDNEQRTDLFCSATNIALIGATTFDVENELLGTIVQQEGAISSLLQCSVAIQENQKLLSDTECLNQHAVQAWRSLMYRICTTLRDAILRDCSGLNEAVLMCWAAFRPEANAGWTVLNHPHPHWLHVTSGKLPVHINLLTGELLVNGLPLTRLPSVYLEHHMYSPLFSASALEVAPTDEPGMRFSAKTTYHGHELHFGMDAADMLIVAKFKNKK